LMPAERIAKIVCADGRIEVVSVPVKQITGTLLHASEVGRKPNEVLVELPRESASGRWRVWVNADRVEG